MKKMALLFVIPFLFLGACGGSTPTARSGSGMMGDGWHHANGTYGMVFSFTAE